MQRQRGVDVGFEQQRFSEYVVRAPGGVPRRAENYDGRDSYEEQRDSSAFRNEQFRNPYEGNRLDQTWRHRPSLQVDFAQRRFEGNGARVWNQGERVRRASGINARAQLDFSSDEFSDDEDGWTRRQFRPRRNFRRITEAEIRDADRRMEKWHLSFSGDARSRSLEDFLLKVRRLAAMDRIADDVLMQRIHTILRGEAYDWYLCYADEFHDWKQFEERIRYMYGNPNKDQGNRQKIYERKQNRNETFLSFKMELYSVESSANFRGNLGQHAPSLPFKTGVQDSR